MSRAPVVAVETGSQVDLAAWDREHRAGQRADRTPYGLELMAASGVGVRTLGSTGAPLRALLHALLRCTRLDLAAVFRRHLNDVDVLLTQHEKHGVPAVLASWLPGRPPVVTGVIWLTDDSTNLPPVVRRLLVRLLSRADGLFVLSRAQLPVVRSWGVPAARVRFVPFGVNTGFWCPTTAQPEPDLVVSAGTDRDRDYPTLLAAARLLDGVRLQVAGPALTPLMGRPDPGTTDPGATDSGATVELLGRLSHPGLRAVYRRAAVVAVATRPNLHVSGITVVLEAMACGVPVVVSGTAGMADYVRDGVTGVLVAPGDPVALAAAVRGLLADPARARRIGRAGRLAAEQHFSAEHYAAGLAELCRAVTHG